MKWIKASERLPEPHKYLNLKWFIIVYPDNEKYFKPLSGYYLDGHFNTPLGKCSIEEIEWLDESEPFLSEVDNLVDALNTLVIDIKTSPTSLKEWLSNSLSKAEEVLKPYLLLNK